MTNYLIGLDEVGTGSDIGSAYVGAFRAPQEWSLVNLKDSKKLTAKQRCELAHELQELCSNDSENFKYYIQPVSLEQINQIGLYRSVNYNYIKALQVLYKPGDIIILDGNKKPDSEYPIETMVKADNKIPQVMAAAILAKVERDQYVIEQLHSKYPQYNWAENKGYLTAGHKLAIKEFGLTEFHRNYKIKL